MIYKLESIDDKFISDAYEAGMNILNNFWGINWVKETPDVYLVQSRKDIDSFRGGKTESWVVGWGATVMGKRSVFLLDLDKMETESNHKKDKETYSARITHELCHQFMSLVAGKSPSPGSRWWNEGVCSYVAGQIKFKKRPEKFTAFLESNNDNPSAAYNEGTFVVELLVQKFGKEKVIEFEKYLGKSSSDKSFSDDFKTVYGFELTYEKINELYLGN